MPPDLQGRKCRFNITGGTQDILAGQPPKSVLRYNIENPSESTANSLVLVNDIQLITAPFQFRPRAKISIGNNGVSQEFELDYANGTQFNMGGSTLDVSAYALSPVDGIPPVPVRLGAFISFGNAGTNTFAKFTEFVDNPIAPAGTLDIRVAKLAQSVRFYRTPRAQTFAFYVLDGNLNVLYDSQTAANAQMELLELSTDAQFVRIENTGAANITGRCIFNIGV